MRIFEDRKFRAPHPDELVMQPPASLPEYRDELFLVPKTDRAQAEASGYRVMAEEEWYAVVEKRRIAAIVRDMDHESADLARSEYSRANRWRAAALILGAVALVTTALAAWLVRRRQRGVA